MSTNEEIGAWVKQSLTKHQPFIQRYHRGETGLLGMFVGEVMKLSGNRADPQQVNDMVKEALKQESGDLVDQ